MDILSIKPQSILFYIAPTNAGKSYFTTNYLIPQIRSEMKDLNRPVNIQHISSDNFRREMLGDLDALKNDKRMNYSSEHAFKMLNTKLELVMSYPINADFIIVDTTGLSKPFRDEIKDVAFKNHYTFQPILFDYKNRNDYMKYSGNEGSLTTKEISLNIKKFREKFVEFTKKEYPNIQKIKSIDFSTLKIEIENKEWYSSHFLSNEDQYTIIGDVHQSYNELKELIIKNEFIIDENDLIR